MSRIGKKIIALPDGVTATIEKTMVTVQGPKGVLKLQLHPCAQVVQREEDGKTVLEVQVEDPQNNGALWGTMRALLAQKVKGVSVGFTKVLELSGVGFKMNLQGNVLTCSLGFSHDMRYTLPEGVAAKIENTTLTLTGADAEAVGRAAAEIRAQKKPEPYKGKGFRYSDEIIRRKAGKAAKGDK